MTDLTYRQPEKPKKAFAVGDAVDVLDRNLEPIGSQKVIGIDGGGVETDCGRQWTHAGWWIGHDDQSWPFPSIRLVKG